MEEDLATIPQQFEEATVNDEFSLAGISGENEKDESVLSEGLLLSQLCCRLCARGVNTETASDITYTLLTSVVENIQPNSSIHSLINKYLPIQVKAVAGDSPYPKFICSVCLHLLEETIQFFNAISEGQALLRQMINGVKTEVVRRKKKAKGKKLTFSSDNPLKIKSNPAKIRDGRTKECVKTQGLGLQQEIDVLTLADGGVSERRTKRQSRPPVRYVDEILMKNKDNGMEGVQPLQTSLSEVLPALPLDFHSTSGGLMPSAESGVMEIDEFLHETHNQVDFTEGKIIGLSNATVLQGTAAEHGTVGVELQLQEGNQNATIELYELGDLSEQEDDERKDKTINFSDLVKQNYVKKTTASTKRKRIKRKQLPHLPIKCDQCSKTFNHASSLLYHHNSVHELSRNFVCSVCGRGFAHKNLLNNHMYVHGDEKYFACDVCPAKFKGRATLYSHKKSMHSVKNHTCEVCGSQFSLKSTLDGHMRIHTGEKPFQCEFCQKKFAQRSSLREHRRTHTGEKPYRCTVEECSKSFATSSQLRNHRFSHSNVRSHLCQFCGKSYSHVDNFKYHMRSHTLEQAVECTECHKQFPEPLLLKKHMRVHTREKKFKCDLCNKLFSDNSSLCKHKKTHFNEAKITETIITQPIEEFVMPEMKDVVVENLIEAVISSNEINLAGGHLVNIIPDSGDGFMENDGSSIVQILSSPDDLENFQAVTQNEQDVGQVIYVYSEDGSLFTFAMSEDQPPLSVGNDDDSIPNLNPGTFSTGLETFNPNDMESHYYSLETVGDSTIAVPIQMPLSRHAQSHGSTNQFLSRVPIDICSNIPITKPCDESS